MSLKTAWLNLQDGLGNRFAWSHVNAIYYSQAQSKLLKDKLDEMETATNGKVAKTDIVQVESTSQSTVPSSAYLKTVKDALDADISELNSGLLLKPYTVNNFSLPANGSTAITVESPGIEKYKPAFIYESTSGHAFQVTNAWSPAMNSVRVSIKNAENVQADNNTLTIWFVRSSW